MSNTVFVSNISYQASSEDLGKALQSCGKVLKAFILVERRRGFTRSRGIGFVQFETAEEMNAAVAQTGNVDINGRKLKIAVARPKQPRVTAFIAGIPAGTTKEMILEAFKDKKVVDARIVRENQEGGERPRKGFGFLKFESEEATTECVKSTKSIQLNGGETIVRFARQRFDAKPRRRFTRRTRKAEQATPAEQQ